MLQHLLKLRQAVHDEARCQGPHDIIGGILLYANPARSTLSPTQPVRTRTSQSCVPLATHPIQVEGTSVPVSKIGTWTGGSLPGWFYNKSNKRRPLHFPPPCLRLRQGRATRKQRLRRGINTTTRQKSNLVTNLQGFTGRVGSLLNEEDSEQANVACLL